MMPRLCGTFTSAYMEVRMLVGIISASSSGCAVYTTPLATLDSRFQHTASQGTEKN